MSYPHRDKAGSRSGDPWAVGGALSARAPKSKCLSRTHDRSHSDHHHVPEGLGGGVAGRHGARRGHGTGLGVEG